MEPIRKLSQESEQLQAFYQYTPDLPLRTVKSSLHASRSRTRGNDTKMDVETDSTRSDATTETESGETQTRICVRDMIQRYNHAAETALIENQLLRKRDSKIQRGVSKDLSRNNMQNASSDIEYKKVHSVSPKTEIVLGSRELSVRMSPTVIEIQEEERDEQSTLSELVLDEKQLQNVKSQVKMISIKEDDKNHILKNCNSVDACNINAVESSYQSRTTIAKTSNGVRIIIDIFFDAEKNVLPNDVIGSRVETAIPKSRILSDFQHRASAARASASTGRLSYNC